MDLHDKTLNDLVVAIVADNTSAVSQLLAASPSIATASFFVGATRRSAAAYFMQAIDRHIYAGDTALHIAAAAYRYEIGRELIALGADPGAKNRLGSEPLHYSVEGTPGSAYWNPARQASTISLLIEHGADPNAMNADMVTPLHRAVRTRCSAAVRVLLDAGADPLRKNKNRSTPVELAKINSGRKGSGSEMAKAEQTEILRLLYGRRVFNQLSGPRHHVSQGLDATALRRLG